MNQGEVELSELAQQQAQNPEVKQFAEQMVQDHRQLIQQLQQVAGTQSGAGSSGTTGSRSGASASSLETSSSSDTAGTTDTSGASGTRDLPGTSAASGTTSVGGLSSAGSSSANGVVSQLAAIDMQIAQRKTQMMKDELQQKQGAEFDKAYIGSAIPAHLHALAALEVLGQQSQGQLAQLAQQARPKVQQHLDHAKQLMKQLDQQSGSSNDNSQAERSGSRTQR